MVYYAITDEAGTLVIKNFDTQASVFSAAKATLQIYAEPGSTVLHFSSPTGMFRLRPEQLLTVFGSPVGTGMAVLVSKLLDYGNNNGLYSFGPIPDQIRTINNASQVVTMDNVLFCILTNSSSSPASVQITTTDGTTTWPLAPASAATDVGGSWTYEAYYDRRTGLYTAIPTITVVATGGASVILTKKFAQ